VKEEATIEIEKEKEIDIKVIEGEVVLFLILLQKK
jgi:hypothetical protein